MDLDQIDDILLLLASREEQQRRRVQTGQSGHEYVKEFSVASSINRTVHTAVITVPYGIVPYG